MIPAGGGARKRLPAALRLGPDAHLVELADLLVDDLAAELLVLVGRAVQVEVPGVDGPLVDELVLLGAQVLEPVVPLGAGVEVAQRLDVDGAGNVGGAGAVAVAADHPPLV